MQINTLNRNAENLYLIRTLDLFWYILHEVLFYINSVKYTLDLRSPLIVKAAVNIIPPIQISKRKCLEFR